jgi:hypothetical protein
MRHEDVIGQVPSFVVVRVRAPGAIPLKGIAGIPPNRRSPVVLRDLRRGSLQAPSDAERREQSFMVEGTRRRRRGKQLQGSVVRVMMPGSVACAHHRHGTRIPAARWRCNKNLCTQEPLYPFLLEKLLPAFFTAVSTRNEFPHPAGGDIDLPSCRFPALILGG